MPSGNRGPRSLRHASTLLALALLAPACGRDVSSMLGTNQPPEIEIVDARAGRDPGSPVHVRWAARDPEGRLAATHWRLDPWATRSGEEHTTTLEECVLPPEG